MPIDWKEMAARAVTTGVDAGIFVARRLGDLGRSAAKVYNTVADQLPVPLPRLGDDAPGPGVEWQPPPPPPRPAAPKPVAEPPRTLKVEHAGPAPEKYRERKATSAPKPEPEPEPTVKAEPAPEPEPVPVALPAEPEPTAAPERPSAEQLMKQKKAELQALCKERGLEFKAKMTKARLVELLTA